MPTFKCKKKCTVCGRKPTQRCPGCKKRTYCSKRCQKYDWSRNAHRNDCPGKKIKLKIPNDVAASFFSTFFDGDDNDCIQALESLLKSMDLK